MQSKDSKPAKIYVDLDSILDTRLAVLADIDEDIPKKVLSDLNWYYNRNLDEFPNIDAKRFKEIYATRTEDVLPLSVMTNIMVLLQSCVKSVLNDQANGLPSADIEFVINCYPYNLDPEEQKAIANAVSYHLAGAYTVEVTSFKIETLTPQFCKEEFCIMIMYDLYQWINCFSDELTKKGIPTVTVISPAIYYNERPTDKDFEKVKKVGVDPFRLTEIALAPAVTLRLLSAEMFSIDKKLLSKFRA